MSGSHGRLRPGVAGGYVVGSGVIHGLAPEAKLVAVIAYVVLLALTPRRSVPALVVDLAAVAIVAAAARLGWRHVAGRMAAVVPFVAFALVLPFVAGGQRRTALGVELSEPGLWATWNIGVKAVGGALATTVLAGTTPLPHLLNAMARLRVPAPFVAIAGFMMRYLDLVADELDRVRIAMVARAYRARGLGQVRPVASSAGAVFVRSFERGERAHAAMVARGYHGTMPVLDRSAIVPGDLLAAALPLVAAVGLAGALWL